jgi:ADP-heptose:LPS heptosyltransferase
VNGGYGRMVCSIPALELYAAESGDDDFIIVCEGGTDAYKGHPLLDDRAYDVWQKNLFKEKLKDRELVSTEPYRIFEYYNQECSLSQAFDIQINNKGIRELSKPTMNFSREELLVGRKLVSEVKSKVNKDKTIVIQPFGRGMQHIDGSFVDTSGRSIEYKDLKAIIRALQSEKFVVILMAEMAFDFSKEKFNDEVAMPENVSLRQWATIIKHADHFLGCDSVGQHLSYVVNTKSTIVTGSTFPINVSYPEADDFNIVDLGMHNRVYDPIRILPDEATSRKNENIMNMTVEIQDYIIDTILGRQIDE